MVRRPKPKPDPDSPGNYLPNGAAAKAALNKAILASCWGKFAERLSDETDVIEVPAYNTSQRCHSWCHIDKRNRESQAEFRCGECGNSGHADVHAAMNIYELAFGELETCRRTAVYGQQRQLLSTNRLRKQPGIPVLQGGEDVKRSCTLRNPTSATAHRSSTWPPMVTRRWSPDSSPTSAAGEPPAPLGWRNDHAGGPRRVSPRWKRRRPTIEPCSPQSTRLWQRCAVTNVDRSLRQRRVQSRTTLPIWKKSGRSSRIEPHCMKGEVYRLPAVSREVLRAGPGVAAIRAAGERMRDAVAYPNSARVPA